MSEEMITAVGLPDPEKLKQDFLNACRTYIVSEDRQQGLERLLKWLEKNGFYTAPASTRFHGCYPGGLAEHSLDVLEYALRMLPLCEPYRIDPESVAVAALFHDVCKVNFYRIAKKNQKIKDRWKEVDTYIVDEKLPFGGHGSKSVYIVSTCMMLKADEATAINCHMGAFDAPANNVNVISQAYERYPLAWLIHVADEAATYIRKRNKPEEE